MMKKHVAALALSLTVTLPLAACVTPATGGGTSLPPSADTDTVTSASQNHYADVSFDEARLLEAVKNMEGAVTIATVNADGTPNLSVAIPGAYSGYIAFAWAPNATKDNLLREGHAMICCYVYDLDAETKYAGARARVSPLTDQAVLDKIAEENPDLNMDVMNFLQIDELLPIG